MSDVSVSIKLSPKQAGALYMLSEKRKNRIVELEQQLKTAMESADAGTVIVLDREKEITEQRQAVKTVYVVEALRWGDRENHSYVVGVYVDMDQAENASKAEKCWRGGKYDCEINAYQLGEIEDEKLKFLNGEIV